MSRFLRASNWSWASALLLFVGTIISSAAGSLLVQYAIEGTKDGPARITLLGVATFFGGALVWFSAGLNNWRSARAGWFLHCTAAVPSYQRQRFESEDQAYRQWALQQSPSPHILPRLQIDAGHAGGTLRYLEAVERDLEVAFGISSDVRQQVYLLANGLHEANFWLGWHLVSTFRRSVPLKAVAFVTDLPAAPGSDSHAVIDQFAYAAVTGEPPPAITLDITRRRSRVKAPAPGNSDVKIALTCLSGGGWAPCECEHSHRSAIIAIDPEVDLSDTPDPRRSPIAAMSPRMKKAISNVAPQVGADAVLWMACDGIESSAQAYTVFLQTVTHAIHEHTAGLEQRYLAFTGPAVLATLLGVHLSKRGRWSFLAFQGGAYVESPDPRGRRLAAAE